MLHRVPSEPNHPTSSFQIQRKDEIFKNFRASYIFFPNQYEYFYNFTQKPNFNFWTFQFHCFAICSPSKLASKATRLCYGTRFTSSYSQESKLLIYNIISPISSSIAYTLDYSKILKFLKKVLIMMNQDLSHLNQFFK